MKHLWPLLAVVGMVACGDSANPTAPSVPPRDQKVTAEQPAPSPDPPAAEPTPSPSPAPAPAPGPSDDNPPPPGLWGSNGFTNGNAPVHLCDDFRMGVSCLVVAFGPSSATIRITNNNSDEAQLRDVFFTVYERNLPDTFESQTKYDPGSAHALGLKPHQSAVLTVTFPACQVQLDVYVGPEINTPPHPAYKLLGAEHIGGADFCNAAPAGGSPAPGTGSGPMSPAPAPGSGSPTESPTPSGSPSPTPPSVCAITAPSLHMTSAIADTSITVTATPTWTGAGTGTIAWGDTTSSAASNGAPISHTYTRQSADSTFSAVLSVGTGSAMCSAASGISVPKIAATCPAGKAVVVGPTIAIEGSMARATFSIASGCSGIEVSLATYMAPAPTIAYPQSLFASDHALTAAPQKFNAGGPYTLTAPMPACFWQVDLVLGQLIETLTDTHLYGSRTIAFRNGGTVSCPAR